VFKKILAPVDGTDLSESILGYVSELASKLEAEITLLAVINPNRLEATPQLSEKQPMAEVISGAPVLTYHESAVEHGGRTQHASYEHRSGYASQVFERTALQVRSHLTELAETIRRSGASCEVEVHFGYPAEEILGYAAAGDFDLIAMATHGRNALARGIMGSVADKVVRTATTPVLVMAPSSVGTGTGNRPVISRILAPLDGSPNSEGVLACVEDMAKAFDASVTVLRVIPSGGPYTGLWDDAGLVSLYPKMIEVAESYSGQIADRLRENGVDADSKVTDGPATLAVMRVVDEVDADLIVLVTKGLEGLSRVVLGSVTETAIRASHRPVLVVPPVASPEVKTPIAGP
jgi:nucleotide-binding universal stress UspA family protein